MNFYKEIAKLEEKYKSNPTTNQCLKEATAVMQDYLCQLIYQIQGTTPNKEK